MTSQTMTPPIAAAAQVHQLQFARGSTKKLIDGIPPDKLCTATPTCSNHVMWLVGHFATTDDYFIHEFGGSPFALPEEWHKTFGMKSKPSADASQYPPFDEVVKAFDERRAALIKMFGSMSEAQLKKPSPEGWLKYAPTIGDLAHFMAWHEGYHCGQIATLRKSFGLASAFG